MEHPISPFELPEPTVRELSREISLLNEDIRELMRKIESLTTQIAELETRFDEFESDK